MRLTPLGHPEGCPYRASFVGTRQAVSANRVNYFVGMALEAKDTGKPCLLLDKLDGYRHAEKGYEFASAFVGTLPPSASTIVVTLKRM